MHVTPVTGVCFYNLDICAENDLYHGVTENLKTADMPDLA